jgi:hypothetical protein
MLLEYRVLRNLFGSKSGEVIGEKCTVRSFIICSPPEIGQQSVHQNKDWMGSECSTMRESRGSYCVSVGKPRIRDTLEEVGVHGLDNIKLDLQRIEWG